MPTSARRRPSSACAERAQRHDRRSRPSALAAAGEAAVRPDHQRPGAGTAAQPRLDPLKYVRDRLANDPTPQQNLAQQRNAEAFRLPAQAKTRAGLEQLQGQVDAWVSYQRLPWLERQTTSAPPRPPTINGQAVTQDVLTRWRGILMRRASNERDRGPRAGADRGAPRRPPAAAVTIETPGGGSAGSPGHGRADACPAGHRGTGSAGRGRRRATHGRRQRRTPQTSRAGR